MSIVPEVEPTVYLVLDDYGPKIGRAYVNTDELQATEEATVDYMLRGEYSNPVRVVAFNTAEGWSRDMSVPIAQAVLLRAIKTADPIPRHLLNFVERHTNQRVPAELVLERFG
jgi:hypothetical protein